MVDQLRRCLRPPDVNEVGEQAGESTQVRRLDCRGELVDCRRVHRALDQTDDPLFHHLALGPPYPQMRGPLAGRVDPLDRCVREAQADHLGDLVQRVGWQGRLVRYITVVPG